MYKKIFFPCIIIIFFVGCRCDNDVTEESAQDSFEAQKPPEESAKKICNKEGE